MGSIVETSCGKLEGDARGDHERFLGIPFAAPPVGTLRFRAPRPPVLWAGVRDARRFGPGAPQVRVPSMDVEEHSESCLTLNVFTPRSDGQRRPVLFWIHGGGFTNGSAAQPVYDGGPLCERGEAVVVTIQYRLGALGYVWLPRGDANVGVLDQIAALHWVQENISRFGGDPANLTIFGESGGGTSVATLLSMPRAAGLFRRAIAQSGAAAYTFTAEDADRLAGIFAGELGLEPGDSRSCPSMP
jgi:para-nitrobenzyl esterase